MSGPGCSRHGSILLVRNYHHGTGYAAGQALWCWMLAHSSRWVRNYQYTSSPINRTNNGDVVLAACDTARGVLVQCEGGLMSLLFEQYTYVQIISFWMWWPNRNNSVAPKQILIAFSYLSTGFILLHNYRYRIRSWFLSQSRYYVIHRGGYTALPTTQICSTQRCHISISAEKRTPEVYTLHWGPICSSCKWCSIVYWNFSLCTFLPPFPEYYNTGALFSLRGATFVGSQVLSMPHHMHTQVGVERW